MAEQVPIDYGEELGYEDAGELVYEGYKPENLHEMREYIHYLTRQSKQSGAFPSTSLLKATSSAVPSNQL